MATSVLPLFTDQTLSWVSYKLSSLGSRAFPQNPFCLFDDCRDVVVATIATFPGYDVVLAGHSLSGGIANIAGSEVDVRSVGVCPPMTFLRATTTRSLSRQTPLTRAVVPERDSVTSFGKNGCDIVSVPFNGDPFSCHLEDKTTRVVGTRCQMDLTAFCFLRWQKWHTATDIWKLMKID